MSVGRRPVRELLAVLAVFVGVLFAFSSGTHAAGSGATATSDSAHAYDLAARSCSDCPAGEADSTRTSWSLEVPVSRSSAAIGTSTTPSAPVVATNTGGYDLYHGTDADSAQDIVENGLSQGSAGNLGGGDVFWVTTSLSDAKFFSQANPADGPPAVVGIDLPAGVAAAIRSGLLEPVAGLPGAYTVKDWSKFNGSANFGIAC